MSFEATAEVYNEVCRTACSENVTKLKRYLQLHPLKSTPDDGMSLTILLLLVYIPATYYLTILYYYSYAEVDARGLFLLSRKTVAEAFWNRELENELRSREWTDRLFVHARSREELMMIIDKERASTVYPHEQCSHECKQRGMFFYIIFTVRLHIMQKPSCMH